MAIKGINLGGWLLMEGYILGGRNITEGEFKRRFKEAYGPKELSLFEQKFRESFITEEDLRIISSWGAGFIRLPFHYNIFETKPFVYNKKSLQFLKKILGWCKKYKLKAILDLHAACGSQNHDWHSDGTGETLLWENSKFQERTYALWEFIAASLTDEKALYGYDVLNEPVLNKSDIYKLRRFYKRVTRRIRGVDKNRIIFLEGNRWGRDIDFLKDILSDKITVSIHPYEPANYTFNFRKNYSYPGVIDGSVWNKNRLREYLSAYKKFSLKYNVEIYAGEFGINYRGNRYGELIWLDDILSVFREFGFGWAYWTYKAISNAIYPDGIVQYLHNPPWVRREGPVYGIENLYTEWEDKKHKIIDSWKTKNFNINYDILKVLKRYFSIDKVASGE